VLLLNAGAQTASFAHRALPGRMAHGALFMSRNGAAINAALLLFGHRGHRAKHGAITPAGAIISVRRRYHLVCLSRAIELELSPARGDQISYSRKFASEQKQRSSLVSGCGSSL